MRYSVNHLLILFLLLQLIPQAGLSGTRDVWVYIYRIGDLNIENAKINFRVESHKQQYSSSRFLSESEEWLHFTYPVGTSDMEHGLRSTGLSSRDVQIELELNGQNYSQQLPPGKEPVFIGIRRLSLFPLGVEIWTESQVLASLSRSNMEIKGKFDIPVDQVIKLPGKVDLYHPFRSDSKMGQGIAPDVVFAPQPPRGPGIGTAAPSFRSEDLIHSSPIEPRADWQSATFSFKFALANPTLVFLKIKDRYYPVIARPHHDYELPFTYEKWTRLDIGPHPSIEWDYYFKMGTDEDYREADIAQRFFNNRYPMGLKAHEYNKLVMTLKNYHPGKSDTLMAWAHAIVPMYERMGENPDELLELINKLGRESLKEVFENAYRDKLNQEEYLLRVAQEDRNEALGLFVFLAFVLFVLAFAGKVMNPQSLIGKHFNKFEAFFHLSLWTLITYSFSVEIRNASWMVNNPLNMLFLWAIGALFYVNALYLVPRLLVKRKIKLYIWSILGMGIAFGFTYFLFQVNPFKDFYWIHLKGGWHGIYKHHSHYEEGLPPVFFMSIILAPIYGLLRNLLLNRVPQLQQQKSHLKSELRALKTQISPHFFFNSLNTVYSYALGEESPKTAEAITKLSDMMRFVIYHGDKTRVLLAKELEYLEDYIELQKLRLNNLRHDVRFRITGEAGELEIAPLILITPIENAFKHGISMNKDSFIYMDLLIQDKGIILTVENSVHEGQLIPVSGKTLGDEESGVGIYNTRQRLDLLYPGNYEWFAEEGGDRYFTQLCIDLV